MNKVTERINTLKNKIGAIYSEETKRLGISGVQLVIIDDVYLPIFVRNRMEPHYDFDDIDDFMDRYLDVMASFHDNLIGTYTWGTIEDEDGYENIPDTDVVILTSKLAELLLAADEETILESMRIFIRHELGHVIDEILEVNSYDTDEDFDDQHNASRELLEMHYAEWSKKVETMTEKEGLRLYYEIPEEASANRNAGITFEDIWTAIEKLK